MYTNKKKNCPTSTKKNLIQASASFELNLKCSMTKKKKFPALNITSDVTCPPLFPPHHGYLECTQPTSYTSGKNQITNSPGSQCILICPNGYRMSGSFAKTCGMNGKWIGADDGECISKYGK